MSENKFLIPGDITKNAKKRRLKVLIADHHPQFFQQISDFADVMADEIELTCKFADSATQALEMISSWEPSVIMLDVYMPDLSAFDVIEQCRQGVAPIVVTSNNQSEDIREAALDRGACAFIPKSQNPDDIEGLFYLLADLAEYSTQKH